MVYQNGKAVAMSLASSSTSIDVNMYDTDDGWHVSKYSNGYMTMSHRVRATVSENDWVPVGSLLLVENLFAATAYPEPFTVFYNIFSNIRTIGHSYGAWATQSSASTDNRLSYPCFSIWRPTKPADGEKIYVLSILVTGTWKDSNAILSNDAEVSSATMNSLAIEANGSDAKIM